MGYLDENNEWVCEDECISSDNTGKYCGTTDHFTSFAILLDGGNGTDDACGDGDGLDKTITYLSIAFIIAAIVIVIIAAIGYDIFFRNTRKKNRLHLQRILTRTSHLQ